MKSNIHVTPNHGKGWNVKIEKNKNAYATLSTQKEAVEVAKTLAKSNGVESIIHGKDGRIRQKNSYGIDPYPPRG